MKEDINKRKIRHIIYEYNYGPRVERNNLILKNLDFRDIHSVLDVGCGMGELLASIEDKVKIKTGIDFDETCVRYAKKANPQAEILQLDVTELKSIKSKSYDAVFAVGILEHVDNPTMLAKECHRISKKYGIFCVPNICRASRFRKAKRNKDVFERSGHKQGWDYYLFKHFLEGNGWKVERIITRFVDVPFYRFLPKKMARFLSYKVLLKLYPRIGSELFAFCQR